MRKSVVLYHANCNDGFAAAYAAGFKMWAPQFIAEVWK